MCVKEREEIKTVDDTRKEVNEKKRWNSAEFVEVEKLSTNDVIVR